MIGDHPGETAEIFSYAFELAMQIELKHFLGAEFYQRTSGRHVYADGYNAKRINTPDCSVTVQVPKTAGHDGNPAAPGRYAR